MDPEGSKNKRSVRRWGFISCLSAGTGGFVLLTSAGAVAYELGVAAELFLMAFGGSLAGATLIYRVINLESKGSASVARRMLVACALGGGIIGIGTALLVLFAPVETVVDIFAWLFIAVGIVMIGIARHQLSRNAVNEESPEIAE